MPRLALMFLVAFGLFLLPATAEAAMTSTVSGDILRVVGDDLDDRVVLRLAPGDPGTLQVDLT